MEWLFASASLDGLAEALVGGGIALLTGFFSLLFALYHLIFAWFTPWSSKAWRTMTILWGVITACFLVSGMLIGVHTVLLVRPYLSVPLLSALSLASLSFATYRCAKQLNQAAGHASGSDAEQPNHANGDGPGAAQPAQGNGVAASLIVAGNRLLPLAWLIAVGAFAIFVFPDM